MHLVGLGRDITEFGFNNWLLGLLSEFSWAGDNLSENSFQTCGEYVQELVQ